MRSGGGHPPFEVKVRRNLLVHAEPEQVWAAAQATLHLPQWSLLDQPVPGSSPPRLFLVRPYKDRQCGVSLLERQTTGTWSQNLVDLGTGGVPYRISLEPTRRGGRLAVEVHSEGRGATSKTLGKYWHRWADTWLHAVDLVSRGKLAPFTSDPTALDGYGTPASSEVASSVASRLFPYPPQHIWDRLTAGEGRPSGPLLHRVRLAPATLEVGMHSLQASLGNGAVGCTLTEVTACRPYELLTQRRLNGPLPSTMSWQLAEHPGGTLLTLEHTSDRSLQGDLQGGLGRLTSVFADG